MSRVAELVAEFVPLNRRRLDGASLSEPERQRWSALRDLLSWEFGARPSTRAGAERALRVPSRLAVRYGENRESIATLHNISEGGLFVETERPFPPGTALRLQLDPGDGSPPLDLDALVIWRRERAGGEGPVGFGLEFRNLSAEVLPGLLRLIERELREIAASSPS